MALYVIFVSYIVDKPPDHDQNDENPQDEQPYIISVNSILKHIHTTSINTIISQFVLFIYHPL